MSRFMLYRGESAVCALSATSVVVLLDSGRNREAQLFGGTSAAKVPNALLKNSQGGLCIGFVSGRGDAAHEAVHARTAQHDREDADARLA